MQRDRLVRGQRPGRGRPDDDAGAATRQARKADSSREIGPVDDFEAHVDRRRRAFLVLDLGLRERGAAVEAPVHGLVALVEMAVADDLGERAQLLRLVARRQREIGVLPVAHDAEPDEVPALHVHLLGRVLAAGVAERLRVEPLRVAAQRLLDLVLDRQSVAVPARHVRRVESVERARLDDDVLQHLVDGVANVDRAVRVRRPIVQDEFRAVGRDRAQLLVDAMFLPPGEHVRLAAREIALHREGGVRQVDGVLVVGHGRNGRRRRTGKCSKRAVRPGGCAIWATGYGLRAVDQAAGTTCSGSSDPRPAAHCLSPTAPAPTSPARRPHASAPPARRATRNVSRPAAAARSPRRGTCRRGRPRSRRHAPRAADPCH